VTAVSGAEGKAVKREIKAECRPAVWTGTGLPVGPVDFSRVPDVPEQPFPAPLRTSRDPGGEPGTTMRGLLALAASEGWRTGVTYAEGWMPHAIHGRPGVKPQTSEALRASRRGEQFRAVRMGDSWSSLWYWSDRLFFIRLPNLDIARIVLALADPVPFLKMLRLVRG
jgi:hypothetical protein